ncbi:geranylgeranyl reductase family protein [Paucibacter oligotrophus]|uniref:Geranylgeranyl reductase family protein n=1 Tax=Roseateles oligotrophus TaxID=1769250 RepID=A0A840LAW3_9BURK|nr:NAD(P)/FAD-dependent oxidoreductase [Roseateles oligotrophus]MBB4843945.1 geranylgeranyl reductase family protein [Roseateles oligotrophus]
MPQELNRPASELPTQCEFLVIGAGPAGSACARMLALAGRDVVLVDAQAFPREKTCGDGLVPDALAALQRLGLRETVMARAQKVSHARCIGPSGGAVEVPGEMAVLPRRLLDEILCRAAVNAGARMFAPLRFVSVLQDEQGRVMGAELSSGEQRCELRARWVVLATGAAAPPLQGADLAHRRSPSSIALRGYFELPGLEAELSQLNFVWHPRISHGYGWIFPVGAGVFNVGVAILDSHNVEDERGQRGMKNLNLRHLFAEFCAIHPLARKLVQEGRSLGELKGAPLRCNLDGAALGRPGLLATGEAIGSTYAFTGEGIGKAMETGIHAAEVLLQGQPDAELLQAYAARLELLRPRFQMYRKATSFNRYPRLVDLVIWRAGKSPRLIQSMAGILNETRMPGSLLSWRGVKRLLLG